MLEFIYKHKILPLLLLPLFAAVVSLVSPSPSVHADGESYSMSGTNINEIKAKGGIWDDILKIAKKNVSPGADNFPRIFRSIV